MSRAFSTWKSLRVTKPPCLARRDMVGCKDIPKKSTMDPLWIWQDGSHQTLQTAVKMAVEGLGERFFFSAILWFNVARWRLKFAFLAPKLGSQHFPQPSTQLLCRCWKIRDWNCDVTASRALKGSPHDSDGRLKKSLSRDAELPLLGG